MDSLSVESIADKVMVEEGHVSYTIGEDVYVIKMLGAIQGIALVNRILKAIIPIAGLWVDGDNKKGLLLPEDDNFFAELTLMFVNKMDELGVEEVIGALCQGLTYNGKEVSFDAHFRCNYSNLLLVLEQAFRENFGTFLEDYLKAKGIDLQGGLQALKTRMQTTTPEE